MMRLEIAVLIFVLLLLPSSLFAKYVAVLETMADPAAKEQVSSSDRLYLTNVLREEAVRVLPAEQNFTIMTRENINAMLPPGKTIEDCEGSCLAETGKNIAADYVAQARVGTFAGALTLSVEMYETAGSKLVASFNADGEDVKALLEIIKQKAPDFFKRAKSGSTGFDGVGGIGEVSGAGGFSFQGSKKFIVEIVTNPAGALPTVDGKGFQKCTSTPCKVQLEAGEHRFVASMERYEDAEAVVNVTANNQQVVLDLAPNFGYLNLRPGLPGNAGGTSRLRMTIDDKSVKYGKIELDPGIHSVSISHPCYDPAEFKVTIERQKSETFSSSLTRGVGGLVLDAEWNGEPQAVPVYIDGKEVGSTPFEGEVPMCAEVSVGEKNAREVVPVNLKWHEVVSVSYHLRNEPAAVVAMAEAEQRKAEEKKAAEEARRMAESAYAELDDKDAERQVGESIPANVESESSGIHWLPVGISAAVAVTGTVLAIVGNSNAKAASEKDINSEDDYKKNKDDVRSGQNLRTVGIVTAIVGAIGVGVSFAF